MIESQAAIPGRAEDALGAGRVGGGSLASIFAPRSVAVIGATEKDGAVGRTIVRNLMASPFGGQVYPVNPHRPSVLGLKAYPSIGAVPERVDLAVIVTPAATVPGVVGECAAAGVGGAIIISAGFKEVGPEGEALEREVRARAQAGRMRIVGPNCLGVMIPGRGLNATFAGAMARPGKIGFLSQSGALCTAVLDWSLEAGVGFSAFVSVGSMLDVGWGDLIDHLGDDPRTESIIIYMETVGDARSFLSAAREVALSKPILVIKPGRTEAAAKAAASHTGSLAGSDEVLDAAFRRCGALRVDRISELFSMAEVLAKQPRPRGPRLAIVTNAGGPGVLATDALIAAGAELAPLATESLAKLDAILPHHWSHGDPIDVLGDAGPDRYAAAVEVAAADPNTDGLLVVLTPQDMTDPTQTAERLRPFAKVPGKPVLASWMGGPDVAAGEAILRRSGVPTFSFPDSAARAFATMWRSSYALRGLYETPTLTDDDVAAESGRAEAAALVAAARSAGRPLLSEAESKRLLDLYGLPTVPAVVATDPDSAAAAATAIGFPVALKLHSETITHKTDVGGVRLDVRDEEDVKRSFELIRTSVNERAGAGHFLGVTVQPMVKLDGYELIVGSSVDAQFGPVLLFGAGGQLVEVVRDRALGLPPLTTTLARRMMERTRILTALQGVRGRPPVDLAALERLLVRFSRLVVELRGIKEIEINPLLAAPDRLLALDARVVLQPPELPEEQLPRLAIRPYPTRYVSPWTLADGTPVTIRPIRPEDEPWIVKFHEGLSDDSVQLRYFHAMKLSHRVAHERLTRICFIDYDRELALVVDRHDPATGGHEILAVGRLGSLRGTPDAEFALLVRDDMQGKGIGGELLRRLVAIGRERGYRHLVADMLARNGAMQRLCRRLGFHVGPGDDPTVVRAVLDLAGPGEGGGG
ncbi:MAG TPA: GNAT family N-acetyltransferase [Isosphaeraceae bacterium]|jgi:acetyltransferase|nr:GNAT family N-acetyltransferase [Isosphaeraceae bacterium]